MERTEGIYGHVVGLWQNFGYTFCVGQPDWPIGGLCYGHREVQSAHCLWRAVFHCHLAGW